MVIEADLFSEPERSNIKKLIERYSDRLLSKMLFGYDNCQLLVILESNIPNDSISILWASDGKWQPLKKRL
jgi:hypothetical protein